MLSLVFQVSLVVWAFQKQGQVSKTVHSGNSEGCNASHNFTPKEQYSDRKGSCTVWIINIFSNRSDTEMPISSTEKYAPFSYFLIDFFSFFDFKFDKNGKIHSTYELWSVTWKGNDKKIMEIFLLERPVKHNRPTHS